MREVFMGISFDYKFNKKEAAPSIPSIHKGKGATKGRIHLLSYHGNENGDIYAVAAKKITVDKGGTPQALGRIDKRYYILIKDPTQNDTYYKINKVSLHKRLGISEKEIKDISKLKLSESGLKLENAIKNKAEDTIKASQDQLGNKIRDASSPINEHEIKEIIKNVPPQLLKHLASKLISEFNNDNNKKNLLPVLEVLQDSDPTITLPPNLTELKTDIWRKNIISDLSKYQVPLQRRINYEHEVSSSMKNMGYDGSFTLFIEKIKNLPNLTGTAKRDTIREIGTLGYEAFRASFPASFHNYSAQEKSEGNLRMGEFFTAIDAIPHGKERNECINETRRLVNHIFETRSDKLLKNQEGKKAVDDLKKTVNDSLDNLMTKNLEQHPRKRSKTL